VFQLEFLEQDAEVFAFTFGRVVPTAALSGASEIAGTALRG
jgi:hypothetical protein